MEENEVQTIVPYTYDDLISMPEEDLEKLDVLRLQNTSDSTLAQYLNRLDADQARILLRMIPEEQASDVLSEMDAESSADIFSAMREKRAIRILEGLDPDDAADVIAELTESERERILNKLEPEAAEIVKNLLSYDPETAGGIMTPEFASLRADMQVDQAIEHIRKLHEEIENIYYVYVIDEAGKLNGVVSMRELILARPHQLIADIMESNLQGVCLVDMDREDAARLMSQTNLLCLPVVDADNRLLGIITVDDVMDIMEKEATEDIQKLVGAGPDESVHDDISYKLKHRSPWLVVNLLTACTAAAVVFLFEDNIQKLPLLAVIMPIIASMGGNTGNQTLAVAIRSIALGELSDKDAFPVCRKEFFLGIINGIIVGILAACVGFLFSQQWKVAAVIFVANVLNMGLAGFVGAFVPITLRRLKFDPAQSSSIFITTMTDVAGFFIFLSLGSWILLN